MNLMKLLTLCCLAVTISMSENFCQTKLLDNIAEQPDYAARPYILRLNDTAMIPSSTKLLATLSLEPYNEVARSELVATLAKDRDMNGGRIVDTIGENIRFLTPLLDSSIFTDDNATRSSLNDLFMRSIGYSGGAGQDLLEQTFRNLLLLDAIRYFKYKENRDDFMRKMEDTIAGIDVPFYFLYKISVSNDENPLNPALFNVGNLVDVDKVCSDEKTIEVLKQKATFKDIAVLYIMSLQYPDRAYDLKLLSYAIGVNSGVWNLFDYFYNLSIKRYDKASLALQELFAINTFRFERAPELYRKFIEVSYYAGYNAYKQRDFFNAYEFAVKTIQATQKISRLRETDIATVTKAKALLQDVAGDVAGYYSSQGELDNANAVLNKTQTLVQEIFITHEKNGF